MGICVCRRHVPDVEINQENGGWHLCSQSFLFPIERSAAEHLLAWSSAMSHGTLSCPAGPGQGSAQGSWQGCFLCQVKRGTRGRDLQETPWNNQASKKKAAGGWSFTLLTAELPAERSSGWLSKAGVGFIRSSQAAPLSFLYGQCWRTHTDTPGNSFLWVLLQRTSVFFCACCPQEASLRGWCLWGGEGGKCSQGAPGLGGPRDQVLARRMLGVALSTEGLSTWEWGQRECCLSYRDLIYLLCIWCGPSWILWVLTG